MGKALMAAGSVAMAALLMAGCSGDGRRGSPATTADPTRRGVLGSAVTPAPAPAAQILTITPGAGLTDGQVVRVVGTGYVTGKTYAAVECADKGNATGWGDCDLHGIPVATADATGTVTIAFPVAKGPFGFNKIVCSAFQKCLIFVANAGSPNPMEHAVLDITFA
jgi:hypothetical protein